MVGQRAHKRTPATEAHHMIIAEVVITPKLALQLMQDKVPELYEGQIVDGGKVSDFAAIMGAVRWGESPDDSPISISDKGRLMNGLHRLTAICESGATIIDRIAFFVPESTLQDGPADGMQRNQFALECAEFILDLTGDKTRNSRTVAKIHDHILPMIEAIMEPPDSIDRFVCAATVAAIYGIASGEDPGAVDERMRSISIVRTTPAAAFEAMAKRIFCIPDGDPARFDVSILLPESIYSATVKDACTDN